MNQTVGKVLKPLEDAIPVLHMDNVRYRSVGMLRSLERAVRQHGPVLRLKFEDGNYKLLLAVPEICDIWRNNSRDLIKDVDEYPAPASLARMILDNNLTTAREGEEWEAMRTIVSPLMRPKMESYATAIRRAAIQIIENLSNSESEKSLWDICGIWSASTVCHPVLGMSFDETLVLDLVNGLRETMFQLVQKSVEMPQEELRKEEMLKNLRLRLAEVCSQAITFALHDDDTMVAQLLRDRKFDFGTHPAPEMVAELQPILIGALAATVHNSSLAMFWLMANLAKSPETSQAIAEEATSTSDENWTVKSSPVAVAAVRESLRLHPVLPFIERKAAVDLNLAGIPVSKGETVVFSPWFVHRDPTVWPDPMSFRPERFEATHIERSRWFPFGLGHRACIGSTLALTGLSRSIAHICAKLSFSIPKDAVPVYWQPTYRVLLEPRENGARLTVKPRTLQQNKELACETAF